MEEVTVGQLAEMAKVAGLTPTELLDRLLGGLKDESATDFEGTT